MHALMLEQVEADARAEYAAAAAANAEDLEAHAPEAARARFEEWLMSTTADRRAGISDDEWELRRGLGVAS